MSVDVKICGLKSPEAVEAAVDGGALYFGFVFCPRSPRVVDTKTAQDLCRRIPSSRFSVGLFVDPTDVLLSEVLETVPLDMIQLHGHETPQRIQEIKEKTARPVIKALGLCNEADLSVVPSYEDVADMLLLDAGGPGEAGYGGRGQSFDWNLLTKVTLSKHWILAGGLCETNLEEAVRKTKAPIVDVSSGVEEALGIKSPEKIRTFLKRARQIETCC
ncbi:MAG: phosphoribosylanthranilate isomerase [Alphaproteobacteria bacterium]|nr:phosphoribosylanthranilate isomerase [Alphaproteobacteria bacterium]